MSDPDRPDCYETWEKGHPSCKQCGVNAACRRATALAAARAARKGGQSRNAGKSRSRSDKALCWECRGGTSRIPCRGPICPKYTFLPEEKQDAGPPDLWWTLPASQWPEAHAKAHAEQLKRAEGGSQGAVTTFDEIDSSVEEDDDD